MSWETSISRDCDCNPGPPADIRFRQRVNGSQPADKPVSQVVQPPQIATRTALVSNRNPSTYARPVTFTATVSASSGGTATVRGVYGGIDRLEDGQFERRCSDLRDVHAECRDADTTNYFPKEDMMKSMSNRKMTVLLLTLALSPMLPIGAQQAAKPSQAELYKYQRLKGRQVTLFDQWAAEQNKKNGTNLHPAIIYSSLTTSQCSTFEAVTHALSRSRLNDDKGQPLRQSALELVTAVNEIAGQVKGLGSDQQFRLYVTLVPDAQEVLTQAREFFRDKDNTVFHKEYPINFRQRGRVPTIQFSIAKDGTQADIDVDYRSSRPPQALVNGHLRAANSDIRVGGNYLGHVRRWFGLIRWWRIILDPDAVAEFENTGTATTSVAAARPATPPVGSAPTLTPAQISAAQEVARAMNDFLTMWLIKRDRRRADDFLTKHPVACANLDDDQENETASGQMAIREFALLLDVGMQAKGKRRTLDEAVAAIEPWDPELVFVNHPYKQFFALRSIQRDEAAEYMCESTRMAGDPNAYGHFHLTNFTLKLERDNGGGLELLWTKEEGRWQIVSYDLLEP